MSDDISRDDVEVWLDEDHTLIEAVEEVAAHDHRFHFAVRNQNILINVIKQESEGPLIIGAETVLPEEQVSIIRAPNYEFFTQIEGVLATSPGIYALTDGNGTPVPLDEVRAVMMRQWIYPDAASQHTVMNGVIDIISSLMYVQGAITRLTPSTEET